MTAARAGSAIRVGLAAAALVWVPAAAQPAVAAAKSALSRLMSYGGEPECLAAHQLPAPLCRSAFANARAEFEAKTPAFPSEAACAKAFGRCMAWPPGTARPQVWRPRWAGVDIVDTPRERSVTPVLGGTSKRVAFAPRPLTAAPPAPVRARPVPAARGRMPAPAAEPAEGAPSAPPPPGSGFTLENGVLTYPAPPRYAPRNLPKAD